MSVPRPSRWSLWVSRWLSTHLILDAVAFHSHTAKQLFYVDGKSHIRCYFFLKCKISGFVTKTASREKIIFLTGEKNFTHGSGKKLFQEITETMVPITPGCCRVKRIENIIYCLATAYATARILCSLRWCLFYVLGFFRHFTRGCEKYVTLAAVYSLTFLTSLSSFH